MDVEDEPAAAARQTILTTWFDGKQRSDGVYESYEPVARALQLVSRSGRTISVSGGSGSDEDHRIVAGLQVRTEPQLAALLHQSEQRTNAWSTRYVLAAPKLASAALADGTVELRGTATATHRTPGTYFAICVTLRHAPVVCSPPVTAIEGNPHIWSLIIGGHWYLAGASSVRSPVGKPVLHALRPPDQVGAALPAETARSDGWWITLLRPAPNVESVVNPDGSPVATRPQG